MLISCGLIKCAPRAVQRRELLEIFCGCYWIVHYQIVVGRSKTVQRVRRNPVKQLLDEAIHSTLDKFGLDRSSLGNRPEREGKPVTKRYLREGACCVVGGAATAGSALIVLTANDASSSFVASGFRSFCGGAFQPSTAATAAQSSSVAFGAIAASHVHRWHGFGAAVRRRPRVGVPTR